MVARFVSLNYASSQSQGENLEEYVILLSRHITIYHMYNYVQ